MLLGIFVLESRKNIPFNVPTYLGEELEYIQQVVRAKKLSGDGEFNKKCVEELHKVFPNSVISLTPSCTAALEMAYLLIDLKPGDEVILPSFTFTSTATAVTLFGATPVFVGVDETLNIDLDQIENAITPRTKAICAVHYAGFSCDMKRLVGMAKNKKIFLIEDAAQAYGASCFGQPLGSFGDISAFSFHETKNIVCGEGGAIVVNNLELKSRAEIVRDKGTNRQRFLRGEVDKYTWQDKGSSYLLGELSAAYLYAQLRDSNKITNRRKQLFDLYDGFLQKKYAEGLLQGPCKTPFNSYNGHIYYILAKNSVQRDDLASYLKTKKIQATTHYVPLHSSIAGKKYGVCSGQLDLTNDLAARLLRLPMFYELEAEEVEYVVKNIELYFG